MVNISSACWTTSLPFTSFHALRELKSTGTMCHLNNLNVAKSPLPLPRDLQYIWSDIRKVIDDLHLKNHRDPTCKEKYNIESIWQPSIQILTPCPVNKRLLGWAGLRKFYMWCHAKTHFHFYLHRMVKRRNEYISYTAMRTTKDL